MKKLLQLTLFFIFFSASFGYPGGNDQRLYESGIAFLNNKNFDQAFIQLSNLINTYKNSPYADDANLVIGKYYYSNKDIAKATEYFNKIITNYKTSDSSDDAFYYLGLIHLQNGSIDEAYKNFSAIKTGYLDSNVLDLTFYNLALVSIHKNQYKKALYFLSNIYTRFSESSIFNIAMIKAAYCFYKIEKPEEGLKMLASLNELNLNNEASDNLSSALLRYTLNRKYKKAKTYYQHPYSNLICTDPKGNIYTTTKKDPHILKISKGVSKRKNTPTEVRAIEYSNTFGLCYSIGDKIFCENNVRSKTFKVNGEILSEIVSFFIDPYNNFWVYDKDTGFLYKFSQKGKLIKQFTYPKVDYVKVRNDQLMFVVSDSRKIVNVKNLEGRSVKQLTNYGRIVDISFDNLGNIYLLADKGKTIVVLNDKFKQFQKMYIGNLGVGIDKANHICVGYDSQIYISSTKSGKIYRVF